MDIDAAREARLYKATQPSNEGGYRRCWASFVSALVGISLTASLVLSSTAAAQSPPGATNGAFQVTSDGQASFNVTISVPPGIQGLAPKLSVTYSSGGGNGLLGLGGGLSGLSGITRCGTTIAQDNVAGGVTHTSNDRY